MTESDKAEAMMRVSEEVAKHDNYVIHNTNEKENLSWIHRRHCRLLASKSIGLELYKIKQRRLLNAFNYIRF